MNIDPEKEHQFARMAALLSDYPFSSKLTESETKIVEALQSSGRQARNVYLLGNRWAVKYYTGYKQRVWATFSAQNYDSAYRLADVLNLRFHHRRVKATQPLSDDTLNITLNRAKLDNENEGHLVSILIQLAALLPDKEPRAARTTKPLCASERLDKLESTMLNAMTEFARLAEQNLGVVAKRLSDELTALRYEIASLKASNGSQVLQRNIITIEPCGIPAAVPHPYIGDPMLPAITCGAFAGIVTPATKENTCCGSVEQDAIVNPQ